MKKTFNIWSGEEVALTSSQSPITPEQLEAIEKQLQEYSAPVDKESWYARHGGVYSKYSHKRLSKSALSRIFKRFMLHARHDYLKHQDLTMDDIIRIGVEQFVVANGWLKPKQVDGWVQNRVRIATCAGCDAHFVPALIQVNQGLCRHCRKKYSFPAIRQFMVEQTASNEEAENTKDPSMLVNFHIMFKNDAVFRSLFLKEDEFAIELEARAKSQMTS